ncbi:ARM repeat-containing protein [Suillus lakei]|nr:ARM repeat-containing protein [Suillus lakei]
MARAIPHPPHTLQPSPSISSPPSTAHAPRLNTSVRDFILGRRSTAKITIKSKDGTEVTFDALKKHTLQPPTVPIPPAPHIVTSQRRPSVSVRIESEETKRTREKKDAEECVKEALEKKKHEEKEKAKRKEEEEAARERQAEEDQIHMDKDGKEGLRREEEECLEAEQAQLEAEEVDDVIQTLSPAGESQEPEDGEVPEYDEVPGPPSALLTARVIEDLNEVAYPEGIKRPDVELNVNVRDGRFRYNRDFLLQFMHICKLKPPTLLPKATLGILGIEPVDQSSSATPHDSSGGHRNASGAMSISASRQVPVGLGIGGFQKPSVPGGFQTGNFQSRGSKLRSEERFAMSNPRFASTGSATSQFRSTMVRTPSTGGPGHPMQGSNRMRSKRGQKRGDANKAPMFQQGQGSGFGVAPILGAGFEPVVPLELPANRWAPASMARKVHPDIDSPGLIVSKVRALLNKLTTEKFESISGQIIDWANKNVNEKDGRTLIQVIRLVFERAINEPAWSEMHARLCQKMMEQISLEVQDDEIKNSGGKPIAGGQLFRKYLLNQCQEYFERGWFAKEVIAATTAAQASDDHATKAAHENMGTEETELYFDEYYAAENVRRQRLGLIKFIGELFKLQMLTERIMHECVKKLLGNVENSQEEEIESLCQLLKTVGQLLDTPKARAHMNAYFTRMKELGRSLNVSSRMQFMLQDVSELRDRRWVGRNIAVAPMAFAAVYEAAAYRQIRMSRGGCRLGGEPDEEQGPDSWAVASGSVPLVPPKLIDLSQFAKFHKGAKKASKREALPQTNLNSDMFHMLSQDPPLIPATSIKPSRPSSRKSSVDLGHPSMPKPAVPRRKLQLLPRETPLTRSEEQSESPPTVMSEADVKRQIDEDVKELFAVRNLEEADVYFTNLPDEHRFRLVDKLVASALESKETDARLVGDFFAQATSNGQCTLEVFEEGFMPTAEFLDDIAIDSPKAFDYMAIMLRGAGFEDEPERLQRIASKLEDSDKLVSLVA